MGKRKGKRLSKTKKRTLILIPLAVTALVSTFCLWWFLIRNIGDEVSVESVARITGLDGGITARYAGVVEPQATLEIALDPSRPIDSRYVDVGDEISEGQVLFAYDTTELELALEEKKLESQRIDGNISSTNNLINILKKERDKTTVSAADKLEYATQIQYYEAQVKQYEYDLKLVKRDIDSLLDQIDASAIRSTMAGTVLTINEPPGIDPYYYYVDSQQAFIVIVSEGPYRVRGYVSEQHASSLTAETPVLILPRSGGDEPWQGVISHVDLDNPVSSSAVSGYMPSDETLRTSRYAFFIELEDAAGLILGQHVYIEPDLDTAVHSGIWLLEYYIMTDKEGNPYVWAADENNRIEKRMLILGRFDDTSQCWEVLDGLEPDDEIAWPDEFIRAGMSVTRSGFTGPAADHPPEGISEATEEPEDITEAPEGGEDYGDAVPPPTVNLPPGSSDPQEGSSNGSGGTSSSDIPPSSQKPSTDSDIR